MTDDKGEAFQKEYNGYLDAVLTLRRIREYIDSSFDDGLATRRRISALLDGGR